MAIRRLRRYRILAIGLAISSLVILAACTPDDPQSTFGTAGPVSDRLKDLFIVIFWAAVGVFVIVEGALLYAAIRFRRRRGQGMPKQTHGHRWLEIGWTIAPAIVLAIIAVPTIDAIFFSADVPSEGLKIKVTAHQWWWEIEYPELNVVTANEVHIPVNEVVILDLESDDVIHSFWVPKLAGKVDVIPTRTNKLWFIAEEEGVFFGQCAEFCGIAHALMRFRVIAQSQGEFEEWVANFRRPAVAATGEAERGRELFVTKGCIICHAIGNNIAPGIPGPGGRLITGPNLTNFGLRTTFAAGISDNTLENLTGWLRNPDGVKPGNRMAEFAPAYTDPNFALSEEDIAALVTYLSSLKPDLTKPPAEPTAIPSNTDL